MKHLIKIDYFRHLDINGNILYEEKDVKNIIHSKGQQYMLSVLFDGYGIPNDYYIGLDNRTTLQLEDTLETISSSEPSSNGYARQSIGNDQFNLTVGSPDANYKADSPIVLFRATGGSWGPVKNVFLSSTLSTTSGLDTSGSKPIFQTVISSINLSSEVTVNSGESVSMKISLGLENFT